MCLFIEKTYEFGEQKRGCKLLGMDFMNPEGQSGIFLGWMISIVNLENKEITPFE
jgi:hypothetical protein